ncbi:MAG: protein kinase, partial [Candidatus Aminicenantes bacterium]|nr:protein kinase [Candidatus Aminicenantes bacterium]
MDNKKMPNKDENFSLSLKEGDILIFTSLPGINENSKDKGKQEDKGEREFIVEELLGKGECTEAWLVKEEHEGKDPRQYAIKILKNGISDDEKKDVDNEINKLTSLGINFNEEKKEEKENFKKYIVVEVKEHGKVSTKNNRDKSNPCYLMEPADCSLKNRIEHFNEKGININFNNSLDSKKDSYCRMVWAFYCMRHLIVICEKLRPFITNRFISHCNVKPENILYFTGEKKPGRTPMLADFRLSEFEETNHSKTQKEESFKKRRKEILKKSVYAAPELKKGDDPRLNTDEYSLGIIFYELIKGDIYKFPCDEENPPIAEKEDIIEYFKKLDVYFSLKDFANGKDEEKIDFNIFIKKTLNKLAKERYNSKKTSIDQKKKMYSELRGAFMALENKFMESLKRFFKEELLEEARNFLIDDDIESAINMIDILFPETVRYCCLQKEKCGDDEIAVKGEKYSRKTCRVFYKDDGINNPIGKIKKKLSSPDDIKEILIQLEKVLDQCYGFMSHCYPHNYYRERLR